jgi:hypothetical protein
MSRLLLKLLINCSVTVEKTQDGYRLSASGLIGVGCVTALLILILL